MGRVFRYFTCLICLTTVMLLALLAKSTTIRTYNVALEYDKSKGSGKRNVNTDTFDKDDSQTESSTHQTNMSTTTADEDGSKSEIYNIVPSNVTVENFSYRFEIPDQISGMRFNKENETISTTGIKLRINSNTYTIPKPDCNRKQLIYKCANITHCFGLADRWRGIQFLFLLAMLTNRTFSISYTKPCPLTNFVIPNFYNWTKCLPSIIRDENEKELYFTEHLRNNSAIFNLRTDVWEQDEVILTTNIGSFAKITSHPAIPYTLPWIFSLSSDKYRHILYHLLFKLTNEVQSQLDTYINKITGNHAKIFVGVHIRKNYSGRKVTKNIIQFLQANYANSSKYAIYLATDKSGLRPNMTMIFKNLYTMNVTLNRLHVNNKYAQCDSLYYAIMEQHILAQSDILIKTISGFSEFAHVIRGPKGIGYEFRTKLISMFTFQ